MKKSERDKLREVLLWSKSGYLLQLLDYVDQLEKDKERLVEAIKSSWTCKACEALALEVPMSDKEALEMERSFGIEPADYDYEQK